MKKVSGALSTVKKHARGEKSGSQEASDSETF